MKSIGQISPIVIWNGQIVDGRLRWLACERAGIEPKIAHREFEYDDDAARFAFDANFSRQNLSQEERDHVERIAKSAGH